MSCWVVAELMVNEIVVLLLRLPEVPVMVMILVPVVAVAPAVNVRTLVDVVGLVANDAVTPLGNAEVDKVTDPANPPEGTTLIVLLPLFPWVTVKLAGEAESEKLGFATAVTVSEIAVL